MKSVTKILSVLALSLGLMNTAAAYVGPGAGLSLLGALWGLLAAVFAALAFVLVWPFRRMLAGRRAQTTPAGSPGRPDQITETPPSQATASTPRAHQDRRSPRA
jgi:membrane protein implicated in regulation of membrane protease activity